MRTIKIGTLLLLIVSLSLSLASAKVAVSDVLQTIVPVTVSSTFAQGQCTTLDVYPGSLVQGTTGFARATCPNSVGAIRFHATTSETPSFLLSVGWDQISIMVVGFACSFSFQAAGSGLVGANITSGGPIPFTATYGSTTILYAGGGQTYDYCLHYTNPPANGITSFTVAWSP